MGRLHVHAAARVLVFVCVGWSTAALADVIELNNGDRITGTVDSVAGGKIVIDTEYAGRVTVSVDAVASLATEQDFQVRLNDGRRLDGKLGSGESGQMVAADDGSPAPVALADIRSAGQSKLALGSFGRDWTSRADLSAAVSTGNSNTDAYNALIESALRLVRSEHSVALLLSQEEADGVSTKEQLEFDYGYKRFFSEHWYFSANGEYFTDKRKDIDHRITAGVGAGYQFWDNSFGALSVQAGGSIVIADLDGVSEEKPALRWGLSYNRFLISKRLELFHKHSILVLPDRGQVFDTSTGLRFAINSRLDTSVRMDLQHETDPPQGNDKTDVTYSMGLGIKF